MNELPIMPIRAKYADETTKGVNIDEAIESIIDDVDTLETTVAGKTDITAVQSLIEGGTVSNAKPIYYHPIVFYKSGTLFLSAIILNNSPTAITSWSEFVALVRSWGLTTARINLSGGYNNVGSALIAVSFDITASSITLNGMAGDGTFPSITITDQFDDAILFDGVNKIN